MFRVYWCLSEGFLPSYGIMNTWHQNLTWYQGWNEYKCFIFFYYLHLIFIVSLKLKVYVIVQRCLFISLLFKCKYSVLFHHICYSYISSFSNKIFHKITHTKSRHIRSAVWINYTENTFFIMFSRYMKIFNVFFLLSLPFVFLYIKKTTQRKHLSISVQHVGLFKLVIILAFSSIFPAIYF